MSASHHPPSASGNARAIASMIDWWTLAGVDAAVADTPRNWLAPERKSAPPPPLAMATAAALAAPTAPTASCAPPAMADGLAWPDSLEAFLDWLAQSSDLPDAPLPGNRVLPRAVEGAALLVVTDMPTDEDMAAGCLLSGADGALLAAMLRATGLNEAQVGVASLLLSRPAGGIGDDRIWRAAALRMRHFVALTAPKAILLLGDQTNRALRETSGDNIGENSPNFKYADTMIEAMRLPAPYILMRHPARKAAAWADLQALATHR